MATLVAYGVPPNKIKLFSATYRDLHKTWQLDPKEFKGETRANFERLFRRSLQQSFGSEVPDLAQADYLFVPDLRTLSAALATQRYSRLVYYGHALSDGVTLAPLHRIAAPQLAPVLKAAGVQRFDILGCNSSAIGGLLATLVPGMTVGTLRGRIFDDVEIDIRTMKLLNFTIVPQKIFPLGGK